MNYERLEREETKPRTVRDWTDTWGPLTPVADTGGKNHAEIVRFCEHKRITLESLSALGARFAVRRECPCLAFGGTNGNGKVVAIKYRPLNGSSHDSFAEQPSVWLRPIVVGDATRFTGWSPRAKRTRPGCTASSATAARSSCCPRAPATFKREWADVIPRGARVALCHDADEDGDAGAEKAAQIIGGRTLRVRPPVEGGDWCDWDGDRDAFLEARAPGPRASSSPPTPSSPPANTRPPNRCSARRARFSSRSGRCSWPTAPTAAGRAPGRSTASSTWPPASTGSASGAPAGPRLHHRERGAAEPLSAEARRQDRQLGGPGPERQPLRLRRPVGRVLVRRPGRPRRR